MVFWSIGDGKALCQGLRQRGAVSPIFAQDCDEAFEVLPSLVRDGDVLLVQGAGNVSQLSTRLLTLLAEGGAQ